jgi:hypothetical protein
MAENITNSPTPSLPYKGADYRAQSIVDVLTPVGIQASQTSEIFSVRGKDRMTVFAAYTHNASACTAVNMTLEVCVDDGDTFFFVQNDDSVTTPPGHTLATAVWVHAVTGDTDFAFDIPVNARWARLLAIGTGADNTETLGLSVCLAVDGGIGR